MAIDLRRLGAPFPVALMGAIGDDPNGAWILEACDRHAIDATAVERLPGVVTAFTDVMVERDGGRRTVFHHVGAHAEWAGAGDAIADGSGFSVLYRFSNSTTAPRTPGRVVRIADEADLTLLTWLGRVMRGPEYRPTRQGETPPAPEQPPRPLGDLVHVELERLVATVGSLSGGWTRFADPTRSAPAIGWSE